MTHPLAAQMSSTDRLAGYSSGVAVKPPVRIVTNANITLSGEQTVNGVAVVDGDRVLVKDQTDAEDNGIYRASTSAWQRTEDFDGNADVVQGTLVVSTHDTTIFYRVTTANPITIGMTELAFTAVTSALTQAIIGSVLYPQSAAEVTAGVTPTAFYHADLPVIDIRRHGYLADDSTDNAAAINAAIDVAGVLGGAAIQLPPGIGRSASSIIVDVSNVEFRGCGRSTIIKATAASFNLFDVRANDVTFRSLALYGAAPSNATTQFGIFTAQANPALRLKARNVYFGGALSSARLNNGIKYDADCDYGEVSGCTFDEMQGAISGTGYGVLAGEVDGLKVHHNMGFGASGRGRHTVYLSTGARYCEVTHNFSKDMNQEHFTISSLSTQSANVGNLIGYNVCVGGDSDSSTGAISLWGKNTGNAIRGNFVLQPGQRGIIVQARNVATDCDSLDNVVAGNLVLEAGTVGIDVQGSTRTLLSGNKVHECSQNSAGVSAAINLIATASSGQAVTDCTIVDNQCTGATFSRCPLFLNTTAPTPTGTVLKGNRFDPGATSGVALNDITVKIDQYTASFTGSLTGCTTVPTASIPYSLQNDQVTLDIPAISATSNTTVATITGMPAIIRPSAAQTVVGITTDNGTTAFGKIIVETSGVLTLHVAQSATFTGSGTKGVAACTVTYKLN